MFDLSSSPLGIWANGATSMIKFQLSFFLSCIFGTFFSFAVVIVVI